MSADSTPKGKIARLPWTVREKVNHKLLDGETYPAICAWLNARADVRQILEDQFAGEDVKPQNLSNWRSGGYAAWLDERQEIEDAKALAQFSASLAEAAGDMPTAGAKAIATGRIMTRLQKLSEDTDIETLDSLILSLTRLAKADTAQATVRLNRQRTDVAERQVAVAEDKFRRESAKLFIEWMADQRAREIAERGGDIEVNMEALIEHIWGQKPA
jgi:hypothetical protein